RHAERHGTEAEIGDTEARAAERADAHVLSLIAEGCPACEPFGGWNHVACGPSSPPSGWRRRLDYQERDPRRPCTGAGAPSPLPCCAVPDRVLPPWAARGRAKPPRRPTPAAGAGSRRRRRRPIRRALRHAAEHEATKAHRLLALGLPATDVRHARGAE